MYPVTLTQENVRNMACRLCPSHDEGGSLAGSGTNACNVPSAGEEMLQCERSRARPRLSRSVRERPRSFLR